MVKSFKKFNKGTYIGARFDEPSVEKITKLQSTLGIKNPVPLDKLHVTVLFSRNPILVAVENYTFQAESTYIQTFEGSEGCVLMLNCPELVQRHEELIKQGGTHDYIEYQPHVTLSYDHPISKPFPIDNIFLNITDEYYEPLDLDWNEYK